MMYRYTQDSVCLNQAKVTANFYLDQEPFREDGIPYWDFHDPKIPTAVRDVSAPTIKASAFYGMDGYVGDPKDIAYADIMKTLPFKEYVLPAPVYAPLILDHSTGNRPNNDDMDEPYADYYFLKVLLRKQE